MKQSKWHFGLFVIFLFATHVFGGYGVVGTGVNVIGKDVIPLTRAGKVWRTNFSGDVVPLSLSRSIPSQKIEPSKIVPSLRGDKIVPPIAKFLSLNKKTIARFYAFLNQEKSDIEIKRAVVTKMQNSSQGTAFPTEEYLRVESIEEIDLEGYDGPLPAYPLPVSKINVYHGMHLTAAGLKNILKNGLCLEDNPNNATKAANSSSKIQYISSFGTAPIPDYIVASADLVGIIYTTVSPEEAFYYAIGKTGEESEVPVILKLNKKYRDPQLKVRKVHYLVKEDIPAEDIESALVLIKDPQGNPIWCKAELSEDDELLLYPYVTSEIAFPEEELQ